jgi:hypothetical protein
LYGTSQDTGEQNAILPSVLAQKGKPGESNMYRSCFIAATVHIEIEKLHLHMEMDATMSDTVSLFSALMEESTYTNIQIKKAMLKLQPNQSNFSARH